MKRSTILGLLLFANAAAIAAPASGPNDEKYKVLVLGAGMAGVMAARQLHAGGLQDFLIVEGRSEIGGRMKSSVLPGTNLTIELGCNWIEGITSPTTGRTNPIYLLAQKYGLKDVVNNWEDLSFYDQRGNDTTGTMAESYSFNANQYGYLLAGAGDRITSDKVDLTARAGYRLTGERRQQTPHDWATEYYNYDWEYAQTPEQSSWIATGNNYNYSFDDTIGFGSDNRFITDQRGYKTILRQDAASFLEEKKQLRLNSTVDRIQYSDHGVAVHLTDGTTLNAAHVIVTFSFGVLQSDLVQFVPALPQWKDEAIQTIKMATYTKIFFVFPLKFWHNSEMAICADSHKRGYYPVWQNLDHEGFFPGSHLYFVTITGDESERVETLSSSQIQAEVMAVLRFMYPSITVPEPTTVFLNRWNSDPLYRGSWANWPSGFYTEHMRNLRASIGGRVHFAGEGTSLDYYGYLHGAYFEGVARGDAVAKCVRTSDCSALPSGGDFTSQNIHFPEGPFRN